MINLKSSAVIYHPVTQIFDFVSMPENDVRWRAGTLAASQLAEGNPSPGTFFRSIGHWLGHRNLGTFEVTDYKQNATYGFRSLSGPFRSQTCYTLEVAENGGTRVNISIQAQVVNFFQTDEGILEQKMKRQLKEDLVMLKDLLETNAAGSTYQQK